MKKSTKKKDMRTVWLVFGCFPAILIISALQNIIFDPPIRFEDHQVASGILLRSSTGAPRSLPKITLDIDGETVRFTDPAITERTQPLYDKLIGEEIRVHYRETRDPFLFPERVVSGAFARGMFIYEPKEGFYERQKSMRAFNLRSLPVLSVLLGLCLWKAHRHKKTDAAQELR